MERILVIAEKPSVGRDIARVLNCSKKTKSYIEGQKYIVTWALGHLLTLASPETYDSKYQHWILEDLPMLPDRMRTSIIPKTKHQFYAIKKLIERTDVSEIVIATDAGREGELVARWILNGAKNKKPVKRLWISSVTDQAIRNGFNSLKPGKAYMGLYYAAVARAEADWILGINGTRAMTVKHNSPLSIGRVQTPTLNMIHEREKMIRSFKPKQFMTLSGKWNGVTFKYHDKKGNTRLFDLEGARKLENEMRGKTFVIQSIDKKQKKSYAKTLYNLTDLQEDANKLFDFSAKQTLNIMQKLYESHKVLTYPRTDSKYLSDDIVPTLKDRVAAVSFDEYKGPCSQIVKNGIKGHKSFVDNKKVSDHHAIIPTEQRPYLSDLSFDERRIYDLVIKRFLSVLMPAQVYEVVKVIGQVEGNEFTATFENTLDLGYRVLYGDKASTSTIPNVKKGDTLDLSYSLTKGQTEPPGYFTEGMLVKAMEEPFNYISIENKALKETLKMAGGIGTVATRGDIIDKLYHGQLIVQKGKSIYTTSKGKQLLNLAPEEMKSPVMTAKWEKTLSDIEKGNGHSKVFIDEVKSYTSKIVSDIIGSEKSFKHDNITSEKCPECGKALLRVENKHGKKLTCSDRTCGYSKKISQSTNARCPNCHKKMTLVGEGDKKKFVCKCGHRETMTAFNKRKNEAKNRGNSRDVNKYLKEMKKDNEPVNNAFADALANFKFNGDD